MNCPNCLSVMYNRSEIHVFDERTKRMDLHCWNVDCPARKLVYTPHMGVLTREGQRWVCWNYHLPFKSKNKWFAMEGKQYVTVGLPNVEWYGHTRIHQITGKSQPTARWLPLPGGGAINTRGIDSSMISVPFIPISTDNNMHEEASKLFSRLMNLVVFV